MLFRAVHVPAPSPALRCPATVKPGARETPVPATPEPPQRPLATRASKCCSGMPESVVRKNSKPSFSTRYSAEVPGFRRPFLRSPEASCGDLQLVPRHVRVSTDTWLEAVGGRGVLLAITRRRERLALEDFV